MIAFLQSDVKCSPPGGLLNFLHNGMNSFPATQSDPITQHSTPGSQVKNAISIDDVDDVGTEKRLSCTPDEDVRLVSELEPNFSVFLVFTKI